MLLLKCGVVNKIISIFIINRESWLSCAKCILFKWLNLKFLSNAKELPEFNNPLFSPSGTEMGLEPIKPKLGSGFLKLQQL
jgi:hypothetical protein